MTQGIITKENEVYDHPFCRTLYGHVKNMSPSEWKCFRDELLASRISPKQFFHFIKGMEAPTEAELKNLSIVMYGRNASPNRTQLATQGRDFVAIKEAAQEATRPETQQAERKPIAPGAGS